MTYIGAGEVDPANVTDSNTAYYGKDPSEVDGLFLRRVGGNTGSGVCRTCNNK